MFMAKRSPLYYSLYCQKIHLSFFRHIFSFFINLSLQQGVLDSFYTIYTQKIEGLNAISIITLDENSFDCSMVIEKLLFEVTEMNRLIAGCSWSINFAVNPAINDFELVHSEHKP